jgi:ribosomal protein L16/L10AE
MKIFLVVFNRKSILQRILKKRYFNKNKIPILKYGTIGLYLNSTFRFEYKYCLLFRKFFKKFSKHKKRRIATNIRKKTWLFIRPNYVLTRKSKNARMGKGKGNFKRWCTIVYPGRIFLEHSNVSNVLYKRFVKKMNNKLKLKFKIFSLTFNRIKESTLLNNSKCNYDLVHFIHKKN